MNPRVLRLSVSKAKTFEHCKRQYYYQYVLKLPRSANQYNALGSMVHLVFETFFKRWIALDYVGTVAEMGRLLKDSWFDSVDSKEYAEAVKYEQVESAKKYIKEYFQYYINTEMVKGAKPVSCEPKFVLPLVIDDLRIEVTGFIDRIDRVDYKTIRILDYKTTGKVQYLDFFQLGIYVAACLNGPYKGHNFEAAYILLKHGNKSKEMPAPNTGYLDAVKKMVKIGVAIDALPKDYDYPPHYTPLCNWCEFRSRCQTDCGGRDEW